MGQRNNRARPARWMQANPKCFKGFTPSPSLQESSENNPQRAPHAADTIDELAPFSFEFLRHVKGLELVDHRELVHSLCKRIAESAPTDKPHFDRTTSGFGARRISSRVTFILILLVAAMTLLVLCKFFQFDTLPVALFAVFVAATVSSTVGFAFSAFAAGILLQIMNDPIEVVQIMLISSIALQTYCVALLWRHIALRRITWLLFGGIITLPIGIYMLLALNTAAYSVLVGSLLAIYGATTFSKQVPVIPWGGRFADTIVGAIGGITGPLIAFPGAAVAIWCSAQGWDKVTQRCVYQPYILAMQILTLAALVLLGKTNRIEMAHALFAIPAILGAHIGLSIFARITDAQFRTLVSGVLVVSGLWILTKGLH